MGVKMRKQAKISGSITVEASFVVPVCLIIIVMLLYFVFYISDAAIATGIVEKHLAKARISGKAMELYLSNMKNEMEEDLKTSLVSMKTISIECNKNGDSVRVSFKGEMRIPFGNFVRVSLNIGDEIQQLRQVEFVRNVRRVADLL